MRLLKVLGALVGISAVALAAPAKLSLDARDEAKGECGVTTVYVTAPIHVGGAYSMTFTRTTPKTAFVYTTVEKSTTTDVVEVTISSENAVTFTGSAVAPISSEIPVSDEPTTILKVTFTRYLARTIFASTTNTDRELEVTPITVIAEPYGEITPVGVSGSTEAEGTPSLSRNRITRLTTYTNWRTKTVRTTSILANGAALVSSYTTNVASAIKQLQDGPDPTPTPVSSQEREQTFDPNEEVVVVEITRIVEPLITPLLEEPASTESSISPAEPSLTVSPHAPFPIFTYVRLEGIYAPAIVGEIDDNKPRPDDEKTTTLTNTLSVTSTSTSYADNIEATGASISSADGSSNTVVPSANSSMQTNTYSTAPYGWNNTYTTMTKVYAPAPAYGYDHLSHDYAASNTVPSAPVQPSESSFQPGSPITFIYSVPVYARTSIVQSEATPDPLLSSRVVPSHPTSIAYVKPGYGNGVWIGPVYGNGKPITDIASTLDSDNGATSTGSSASKPTSANSDSAASTTVQSTDRTSHSSLFSHVVSDISVSDSTVQTMRLPEVTLSSWSDSPSNGTLTRDADWLTRSTITEAPSDLVAPSFLIPTVTTVDPAKMSSIAEFLSSIESAGIETFTGSTATAPPSGVVAPSFLIPSVTGSDFPGITSIATELLAELPASIQSEWSRHLDSLVDKTRDGNAATRSTVTEAPSSLVAPSFVIPTITTVDPAKMSSIAEFLSSIESAGIETFTGSTATAPPSGIVAPSFLMPTISIDPILLTESSSLTASSTSSSASVTATSCGEQGAFSLNFDDVPPLVGNVDQPLPLSSPYKHFYFSEGFAVGPPPRIPFIPESAPLILQFQSQSNVNVTRNDNFPAQGEYGATGEIGNGEYLRFGCYSFDAVAASVGCDSLGPDCEWQFTGVTYNAATGDYDEPYTQFATTPGCPAGENCALTDFVFLQNFKNIQSLRVNVTVEGVPKIWWMDDLQMRWSDDSCEAGNCRASHR